MSSVALNPLTLRFEDAGLERRYRAAEDGRPIRVFRLATAGGAMLMIVTTLLLHLFVPVELLGTSRVLTGGAYIAGAFLAGWLVTFAPHVQRSPQWSTVALCWLGASGYVAIMQWLPPEFAANRGFLFLISHIFTLYGLLRLRLVPAVVAGTGSMVVYLVLLAARGFVDPTSFMRHVFWVAQANIWGILICYQIDLSSRREFAARLDLERERERAEGLLLNILPAAIAQRLKTSRETIAEHADNVTVLFADLVGFTPLSAGKQPVELVALLDRVFSAFDDLARRHGLEKIKTIGDAYMAVAGLPQPQADHARRAAAMALAMVVAVREVARDTGDALQVRVGLHTGPVVAGVIGQSKFSYDLWGDTVNIASRMESLCPPGGVHCTASTASLLEGAFGLEPRGPMDVKGKGAIETFLVLAAPAVL